MQIYSANKGILSSFCYLLDAFGIFLPTLSLLWKEKSISGIYPPFVGEGLKKNNRDLIVYNNKPVLEEKDNEGWCSPNNLKKQTSLPWDRAVSKRLQQTIELRGCNCSQ